MLVMLARFGERDVVALSSFAAEDAVGAVAEAGSLTGRVGDLGRLLMTGDVGPDFLPSRALKVEPLCRALGAAIEGALGTVRGRLDFGAILGLVSPLTFGFEALGAAGSPGEVEAAGPSANGLEALGASG